MKKILALCLSFSMFLICFAMPVSASEAKNGEEAQVMFDEPGNTIMPLNIDRQQFNGDIVYWQGTVHVPKGSNMKLHLYVNSYLIGNSLNIYVKPGTAAGTLDEKYRVATWKGTGHHWVDLALNTQYTEYYVMLWGSINATGAIYTEP